MARVQIDEGSIAGNVAPERTTIPQPSTTVKQPTTEPSVAPVQAPAEPAAAKKAAKIDATQQPVESTPAPKPTESTSGLPNPLSGGERGYPIANLPQAPSNDMPDQKGAPGLGTSGVQVLQAILIANGVPSNIVYDKRTSDFFIQAYSDGVDPNNIPDLYLNLDQYTTSKGTTISSPYYETYGKFNKELTAAGLAPKKASDLVPLVQGYKDLVDRFGFDKKFAADDSIQKYLMNDVSVSELSERMATAKIRSASVDPTYEKALRDLGYINSSQQLQDFFLDPAIGKQALEQRRVSAAVATEASRQGVPITNAKNIGAELIAQGYNEIQAASKAQQGYAAIKENLGRETFLSGIYEGKDAASAQQIQSELESEQFLGVQSERLKKLRTSESNLYQGRTGMALPYGATRYGGLGTAGEGML